MSIRVSPTEINPTHHFSLANRAGTRLGLTLCDDKGEAKSLHDEQLYIKQPVDTTANKQTSGGSSYQDFDYPYSPIVQADLSGGRGSLEFEHDSTKYFDSFRCNSGMTGKAYAGPLEQYVSGIRNSSQVMPANVRWVQLRAEQAVLYKRITFSTALTAKRIFLLARKTGKPGAMTVEIRNDSAGSIGAVRQSLTFNSADLPDLLSEWIQGAITQSFASVSYWLVLKGATTDNDLNHWKIACNTGAVSSYYSSAFTTSPSNAAGFNLCYRLLDAPANKTCIAFEYLEQQYFVLSPVSGAPKLYMAGDRGCADSNASAHTKLIDATKTWTTNEWIGSVVMIIDGPGNLEAQNWRVVKSNTAHELITDAWKTTHTTNTQYVILGTKMQEITGHGLTNPITCVHAAVNGCVYFCMGDTVLVRRLREWNNAGVWTRTWTDESAGTKAVFMTYKPMTNKIVIANNSDPSGHISVRVGPMLPSKTVAALTWGTAINIDNQYRKITGLAVYPDEAGNEAVWVFKTDLVFTVSSAGDVAAINIEEMRTVRSDKNGKRPLKHGVYLYFPLLQGYERFYGGQVDDIGPNLGEGLPSGRRGPIVGAVGYPGKFYIAVNAGANGYSSVLHSGGWHETYRAPKGEQIKDIFFQVSPGGTLDRLWLYQGDDLIWLPFPSETTKELDDEAYLYNYEFAVTLSRMHAGLYDVQKLVKNVKLYTQALEKTPKGAPICWFELDYRLNEDAEWTTVPDVFSTSPHQEVDFTNVYGIAGKRIQFRIRGYTTDRKKTPIFFAIIIGAVVRVEIKSFYGPFKFRIMDDEPSGLREAESLYTAAQKLKIMEDWGDSNNDSMLLMRSVSALCDDKMIFLNMGTRRQVRFAENSANEFKSDVYVVTATMQEA